jgi:flavin-dependent dehydrogenase
VTTVTKGPATTNVIDVLIVGAGPAGAVAAVVAARAGARVRLVDRAVFPRDKLCGDTVNPGTLRRLRRLAMAEGIDDRGLRVEGMTVTGENGVSIDGPYPAGLYGRAIVRRELDALLLQRALDAGCQFDAGVTVRGATMSEGRHGRLVTGAAVRGRGDLYARVTIAADGRRSALAFGLGLARHPDKPRRWAVGAYFENVPPVTCGEMHVRRGGYIGVAPVPGGLTNVCVVQVSHPGDPALRDPTAVIVRAIAADRWLRPRFRAARMVAPPTVLGPLAVDASGTAIDGLLIAGDAAGFIDPMTGDGLGFAVRGGELAALAALQALEHGWSGVHRRLADDRHRAFHSKWRFNRALRSLVSSPLVVNAAALGAALAPGVVRRVIARAGDCAEGADV